MEYYEEEEEGWYNYLTMEDVDDYAVIWMEGDDMDTLWVWDSATESTCTLTTDWKTEDMEDGAWGFFVSDPDGTCPYVDGDEAWTYSWLESDEEGNPISVVGPYGNTW
jgi:hypothetical protein